MTQYLRQILRFSEMPVSFLSSENSFYVTGKIGAILASIPQALAAAALCFIWALTVALGLLTLRHTETASFRNVTIVGVSLFLGLSVPAYFQQYEPELALILPSYFLPYASASSGPFRTGNMQVTHVFHFHYNSYLFTTGKG